MTTSQFYIHPPMIHQFCRGFCSFTRKKIQEKRRKVETNYYYISQKLTIFFVLLLPLLSTCTHYFPCFYFHGCMCGLSYPRWCIDNRYHCYIISQYTLPDTISSLQPFKYYSNNSLPTFIPTSPLLQQSFLKLAWCDWWFFLLLYVKRAFLFKLSI